ncbi:MXAN_6640 family putative metalloprotease [Nocardioides jejuensis]|uniref:Peptidase M6-like domain-containing protein n=1 Tax=Nocardioides jejuensis TaxID=2502782 RepID=A0A4R1CL63_9ACTN|nr:MXAN_6640 family putative metalloprotease [Nocardioides jejuensis]TCJ31195.1 hypothetical protein EPD65_01085 [Nocardioides jejuensis]
MRRRSTQALLGALLLPVALTPAVVSSPASAKEHRVPAQSSPAAEKALDRVLDLMGKRAPSAHGRPTDATLALLNLRRHYSSLDSADRRTAHGLFARPDSASGSADQTESAWSLDTAETAALQQSCNDRFCVHWVPSGTPDDSGAPSHNGATQSYVNAAVAAMSTSWDAEVTTMGYDRPDGDGTEDGGQDLVDLYLVDTATPDNLTLGYAYPENSSEPAEDAGYVDFGYDGFAVVDNDMAELAGTGTGTAVALRTAIAHEFFHLIQFGYDIYESPWLMESTASWMEHQVYPADNGNPHALKYSSMRNPWLPLDTENGGTEYGNWVYQQLTTERLGTDTVLHIWQNAGSQGGDNTRSSMETAYNEAGSSALNEFRMFLAASMAPRRYWSEGDDFYPAATMAKNWTLSTAKKSTGKWWASADHMAAVDFSIKPDAHLTGPWKLRLTADPRVTLNNTGYVMVVYKDGHIGTSPLIFNRGDKLVRSMPFSSKSVSRVGVSLGNASGWQDGHVYDFRFDIWR